MARILIVDDDAAIIKMLNKYLCQEGFKVDAAMNADLAYKYLEDNRPDIILLDIALPDGDGLTIAQNIRQMNQDVGIIMVTGKKEVIDRVVGLEVGADDYIAKPFHLREILARIKSLLRRKSCYNHLNSSGAEAAPNPRTLARFSGWTVDLSARTVTRPEGHPVALTSGEFKLLELFLKNPQRVLNRDQILDHVANRRWEPYDRSVDTRVKRLRQKIEPDYRSPQFIKTVRGEGYVFSAPVTFGPCP